MTMIEGSRTGGAVAVARPNRPATRRDNTPTQTRRQQTTPARARTATAAAPQAPARPRRERPATGTQRLSAARDTAAQAEAIGARVQRKVNAGTVTNRDVDAIRKIRADLTSQRASLRQMDVTTPRQRQAYNDASAAVNSAARRLARLQRGAFANANRRT